MTQNDDDASGHGANWERCRFFLFRIPSAKAEVISLFSMEASAE